MDPNFNQTLYPDYVPYDNTKGLGYSAGNYLHNSWPKFKSNKPEPYNPEVRQRREYMPLGAGVGGLLGYGTGSLLGRMSKAKGNGRAKVLSILGAGMGGFLGYNHKSASFNMRHSEASIIDRINSDYSLSSREKSELINGVGRLNSMDKDTLSRVISTASGSAIGYIIMKFLKQKGLIGALVGGAIGMVLHKPKSHIKTNPFGEAYRIQ